MGSADVEIDYSDEHFHHMTKYTNKIYQFFHEIMYMCQIDLMISCAYIVIQNLIA